MAAYTKTTIALIEQNLPDQQTGHQKGKADAKQLRAMTDLGHQSRAIDPFAKAQRAGHHRIPTGRTPNPLYVDGGKRARIDLFLTVCFALGDIGIAHL